MAIDAGADSIEWNEEILGRRPVQERSRLKVEQILDVSAQAIARDGPYALNLNKVAKEAGVNVATVYQFFPNKNVVIARLALRAFDEFYDSVRRALDDVDDAVGAQQVFERFVWALYEESRSATFFRELWAIIEADRNLNYLNRRDDERLARLYAQERLQNSDEVHLGRVMRRMIIIFGMLRSAIRHAISCDENEGAIIIEEAISIALNTFE